MCVETTVVGHIAARQQADIIVAARQLSSRRWWEIRDGYELVVSQIVVDECNAGDSVAANERLQLIDGIQVLDVSADARNLAVQLMTRHGIPETEPRDALHISLAAVNGIQYLLTWIFAISQTRRLVPPSSKFVVIVATHRLRSARLMNCWELKYDN